MKKVEFKIGNSKYQIECPDSEEQKVLKLAKKIDQRAQNLSKHLKKIDEKTLLATCCLLMEDEIENAAKPTTKTPPIDNSQIENFAKKIDLLANKIENC